MWLLISRVWSFLARASKRGGETLHFFILMFGLWLEVNLKLKYLSGNIVSRNRYSWRLFILYLFNECVCMALNWTFWFVPALLVQLKKKTYVTCLCFTKHIIQPHHQLTSWRVSWCLPKLKLHLCCTWVCWCVNTLISTFVIFRIFRLGKKNETQKKHKVAILWNVDKKETGFHTVYRQLDSAAQFDLKWWYIHFLTKISTVARW